MPPFYQILGCKRRPSFNPSLVHTKMSKRPSCVGAADLIAKASDSFYSDAYFISISQPDGGSPPHANAMGSSSENHRARQKRSVSAEEANNFGYIPDHVRSVGILKHAPIHGSLNP
jgi:hypothetical protein